MKQNVFDAVLKKSDNAIFSVWKKKKKKYLVEEVTFDRSMKYIRNSL